MGKNLSESCAFTGMTDIDHLATSQKVPSVFYYDGWKMRWGYQVNDCQAAIHGVKLLLDDNLKYSYGPSCRSKKLLQSIGEDVTEAAGDYVREIVSHAKNVLHHRFGKALESMDLQFFMTVPAIWSDKAKDATMQIACQAGIAQKNLYMISEPEAAAVCAIQTIKPNNLAVSSFKLRFFKMYLM